MDKSSYKNEVGYVPWDYVPIHVWDYEPTRMEGCSHYSKSDWDMRHLRYSESKEQMICILRLSGFGLWRAASFVAAVIRHERERCEEYFGWRRTWHLDEPLSDNAGGWIDAWKY